MKLFVRFLVVILSPSSCLSRKTGVAQERILAKDQRKGKERKWNWR